MRLKVPLKEGTVQSSARLGRECTKEKGGDEGGVVRRRARSWHVWHIKETNLTKRGLRDAATRQKSVVSGGLTNSSRFVADRPSVARNDVKTTTTRTTNDDREIAEDRARYIGQRSPLFARVAGLPSSLRPSVGDPPRCFLNFARQSQCAVRRACLPLPSSRGDSPRSLSRSLVVPFPLIARSALSREAFPSE